jgi:HEAT repeat protein
MRHVLQNHDNPRTRRNTVFALGQIPDRASVVVPVLIESLHDNYAEVVIQVHKSLQNIGEKAVPQVKSLLGSDVPCVRAQAASILGNIVPQDEAARYELMRMVTHDEIDHNRCVAIDALVKIAPEDSQVICLLRRVASEDKCNEVRLEALFGLLRLDPQYRIPPWLKDEVDPPITF